ncbi:hypothetical protein BOSEA31B_12733 [Hyphomicrobiales bacterium]|nr:hypothetical protein BOSEA31B_12733 [Hyphomicrobiales bacterium]CAH1698503.1 hypothetical protein BOSEA1005_11556 [Hyphomicrobiales bacterium]CAI0342152.1 hypothetical protein BO1005MUT1_170108 [Hyphomicrobiales bacterium]
MIANIGTGLARCFSAIEGGDEAPFALPSLASFGRQVAVSEGELSTVGKKTFGRCLHSAALWGNNPAAPPERRDCLGCGCSSGVEHNLAKVGVEGSNPFARSRQSQGLRSMQASDLPALFAFWACWIRRHFQNGPRTRGYITVTGTSNISSELSELLDWMRIE